jgi:hypothetical protein
MLDKIANYIYYRIMIKIHNCNPELRFKIARVLYYMLCNTINPSNNRVEFNGVPMSSIDLCAYANITRAELRKCINEMSEKGILLNINTYGKDYYYMNPKFVSDEDTHPCLLDWLTEIFEEDYNINVSDLIYISERKKRSYTKIKDLLPKEN